MALSDRKQSEKEEQSEQLQLSQTPPTRKFLTKVIQPFQSVSSTAQLITKFPIAPRKSRHISYVELEGELNTPDACKSNHRNSIFMGKTKNKGKAQIVKKAVEHPALLAMELANWNIIRLLCREQVPDDAILYYDDEPNKTMPGHLNYVALGISKKEGFQSYFDKEPSPDDFKRYEFKKRWIKGLVARHVLAERDAHRRNFSGDCFIIDLDMLVGPITGEYKDSLADIVRPYNEESHQVTERDIRFFPDVEDFKVLFWPTKSEPYIPERAGEFISRRIVELKNNAFRHKDNEMFRSWVNDPDVHYLKFLYYMKFTFLTDAAIKQAALDAFGYVYPETQSKDGSKPALPVESPFVERYTTWVIKRRDNVRKTLLQMPEFAAFITKDGQRALEELKAEFREDNAIVRARGQKKMANHLNGKYTNPGLRRYDDQAMFNSIIDIDDVELEYKRICKDIKTQEKSAHRTMSRQTSQVETEFVKRGRQPSMYRNK